MIYAIVEDEIVVNIAVSNHPLDDNWYLIPTRSNVSIGDAFDGVNFYDQNGKIRMPPETEVTQKRVEELEQENILKTAQIQALSDRNDFLEDCIAEMAGLVYA